MDSNNLNLIHRFINELLDSEEFYPNRNKIYHALFVQKIVGTQAAYFKSNYLCR